MSFIAWWAGLHHIKTVNMSISFYVAKDVHFPDIYSPSVWTLPSDNILKPPHVVEEL